MNYRMLRSACIFLSAWAVAAARAADWPNWRGPDHDGISSESNWLDHWPAAGPAVAWKANVGIGFSSFCVAGGRVYTAGNAENTDTLYCFDADSGRQLWKYAYPAELGDKYFEGGPAATAAVEDGRAYFSSRWGSWQRRNRLRRRTAPRRQADVFARLDLDVADPFKRLVDVAERPTTRSKYIAMLIRQHVEQKEREAKL